MNIYILDPDSLNRVAILNNYSAREWNRTWGESGIFTLWAPITDENEAFLEREYLVWPDNQNLIGVIEYIHKYTDEDSGLPLCEISGRFMESSYLSRRIIWGNVLIKNSPKVVIQSIIQDNALQAADPDRRLASFINTGVEFSDRIPEQARITYCDSYGNLWEEAKDLSLKYGMNLEFRHLPQQKKVQCYLQFGRDLSAVVNLSTDLGFLTGSDYSWDSRDYCNAALIAGEGEGADRTITTIIPSSAKNLNRRELYVDARDLQRDVDEQTMSEEEYLGALTERGQKKLLEYPLYESYECSLQLTGQEGFIFGEDYSLGDIVTLTDRKLKVQVQARVKEHQLSEDKEGQTDILVFGLSTPTITSLIKRRN